MTEFDRDPHKLRMNLGLALQSQVIRDTVQAFENLRDSISALEHLPSAAIEAIREYVQEQYGKRQDACGEFARAYLKYTETPLMAAKVLERGVKHGIASLERYKLPPEKPENS
jgi:hypothetical protein